MEYLGKLLIGADSNERAYIEQYCLDRGIKLQGRELQTGGVLYRFPITQVHLLPSEDGEPYLPTGPEQGHLIYPVNEGHEKGLEFSTPWAAVIAPSAD